jgi:parallel beta-helix repeat protein
MLNGNNASSNRWWGISLTFSSKNTLSGNNASSNTGKGIWLSLSSNNNTLSGNSALSNSDLNIVIWRSSDNRLSENIASSGWRGIILDSSNNNELNNNNATKNSLGIYLIYSSNNILSSNYVSNNANGILLESSNNNSLNRNNVSNNKEYGIFLRYSENNRIYHNNFIQNYFGPANIVTGGNTWDKGYPTGGNYYSDYNDSDTMSGPNQDQPGSDGIGDVPYDIDGGAGERDRYPFMDMNGWTAQQPDITITSPNGGENWMRGTTQNIQWTYIGTPGSYVIIELLKDGVLNQIINSSTSIGSGGSGSYTWLINSTQAPGTNYRVRVTSTPNPTYNDTSNNNFTIKVSAISSIINLTNITTPRLTSTSPGSTPPTPTTTTSCSS